MINKVKLDTARQLVRNYKMGAGWYNSDVMEVLEILVNELTNISNVVEQKK